jgi:ribonuclease HII
LVVYDRNCLRKFKNIKDSKKLSQKQREEWYEVIEENRKLGFLDYKVCSKDNIYIDRLGIASSINHCLRQALIGLGLRGDECEILLDGGLKAPEKFVNQKTIIKGDEKERVISMASICAKVMRDRFMVKLSRQFSGYGFEIHKGYGTKSHYESLRKLGISSIHRKSFLKMLT